MTQAYTYAATPQSLAPTTRYRTYNSNDDEEEPPYNNIIFI